MTDSANIYTLPLKKASSKKVLEVLKDLSKINHKKRIKIRYKAVGDRDKNKKITRIRGYSLYFDIWRNNRHEYQFLKINIIGKSGTKVQDDNNLLYAQSLRDKKEIELMQSEHDFKLINEMRNTDFLEYFKILSDKKGDSGWDSAYKHLNNFMGSKKTFNQLDVKFCEGFRDYLLARVSKNTAHYYYSKLNSAITQAVKEEIISRNPAMKVKVVREETKREFLAEEELQRLIDTPFREEKLGNAFLFSCFTGLRYSDVRALTFDRINDGYLYYRQQKTKSVERIKLSQSALKIIEKQRRLYPNKNNVFNLYQKAHMDILLKEWAKKAGIDKKISLHTARHTFAVMALNSGMDIYTLSKILGHKNLSTTEIYAKLIDKKKDEAIDKLPGFDL